MGADHHPDDDKHEGGREKNAATPIGETSEQATPERYPAVNKDDSIEAPAEGRSFDRENPQPRQGAGDGGPDPSVNQGHMGPSGDPAEGKR